MIEEDIGKRWEQGTAHHEKSEELYDAIAEIDFKMGDTFCFKSGGDGDNGEILMYLMDVFFEKQDLTTAQLENKS